MTVRIKAIKPEETHVVRHIAMWPNKPLKYVQLQNDNDGEHYGLYCNQKIVSVVSIFNIKNKTQFRKFATLDDYQGYGYGTALLQFIIDITKEKGIDKIWCNARVDKINFYEKFGLRVTNDYFTKDEIEYVIMERNYS